MLKRVFPSLWASASASARTCRGFGLQGLRSSPVTSTAGRLTPTCSSARCASPVPWESLWAFTCLTQGTNYSCYSSPSTQTRVFALTVHCPLGIADELPWGGRALLKAGGLLPRPRPRGAALPLSSASRPVLCLPRAVRSGLTYCSFCLLLSKIETLKMLFDKDDNDYRFS